jgi:hypothetical protein
MSGRGKVFANVRVRLKCSLGSRREPRARARRAMGVYKSEPQARDLFSFLFLREAHRSRATIAFHAATARPDNAGRRQLELDRGLDADISLSNLSTRELSISRSVPLIASPRAIAINRGVAIRRAIRILPPIDHLNLLTVTLITRCVPQLL